MVLTIKMTKEKMKLLQKWYFDGAIKPNFISLDSDEFVVISDSTFLFLYLIFYRNKLLFPS